MNKLTDEELSQIAWRAGAEDQDRALHDAGIAHGWREAIEALSARGTGWANPGTSAMAQAADCLERIAKERGKL